MKKCTNRNDHGTVGCALPKTLVPRSWVLTSGKRHCHQATTEATTYRQTAAASLSWGDNQVLSVGSNVSDDRQKEWLSESVFCGISVSSVNQLKMKNIAQGSPKSYLNKTLGCGLIPLWDEA